MSQKKISIMSKIKNFTRLSERNSSLDDFEEDVEIEYIDEEEYDERLAYESASKNSSTPDSYNREEKVAKYEMITTEEKNSTSKTVKTEKQGTKEKIKDVVVNKTKGLYLNQITPDRPLKGRVIAGGYHAFLIKDDYTLWACGSNKYGQLGLGHNDSQDLFTKVPIYSDVVEVIAGDSHTFVITRDHKVYACGLNDSGQLGLGDTRDRYEFIEVTNLPYACGIKQIECGDSHTVICTNDNGMYVCGNNKYGQLGLGDNTNRKSFVVSPIKNVDIVRCGYFHTVISLTSSEGEVFATGDNRYGQLGILSKENKNKFTLVPIRKVKDIACGIFHTFFIDEKSNAWGCGNNIIGELGLGSLKDTETLKQLGIPNVKKIITKNAMHSYIITHGEDMFVCGNNECGQLGLGDRTERKQPISLGVSGILDMSTGFTFTLVLDDEGNLWNCGSKMGLSTDKKMELSFKKTNMNINN